MSAEFFLSNDQHGKIFLHVFDDQLSKLQLFDISAMAEADPLLAWFIEETLGTATETLLGGQSEPNEKHSE